MSGVRIVPRTAGELVARYGGRLRGDVPSDVVRLASVEHARKGDLTFLLSPRFRDDAVHAAARGALLVIDESLAQRSELASLSGLVHAHAPWLMAELLQLAELPPPEPHIGAGCTIGQGAQLLPGVVLGDRVSIGPGTIVGAPGFGFVRSPSGALQPIPHRGGVVIDDDVHVGPLCSIAAGTLGPTRIGRGVKLDALVHVAHNCEIGAGTVIAAQSGLAGSVIVGAGVRIGGQVGIADHVRIGDGASLAAKSGVISDVPRGATFAGYPAVERTRWLRGLAMLYRSLERRRPRP